MKLLWFVSTVHVACKIPYTFFPSIHLFFRAITFRNFSAAVVLFPICSLVFINHCYTVSNIMHCGFFISVFWVKTEGSNLWTKQYRSTCVFFFIFLLVTILRWENDLSPLCLLYIYIVHMPIDRCPVSLSNFPMVGDLTFLLIIQ